MFSWSWSWFGGGSSAANRREAPKKAILSLREQLDILNKRADTLMSRVETQHGIAQKNATTNKPAALAALRRKKQSEKSWEQTQQQIVQLEQHIYSIENANINAETLESMKGAGKALKQIHKGMKVEDVDRTMDDIRDQHELSNEISQAITGQPLGEPLDEAALDEELEELQQEQVDQRMLNVGTMPATLNTPQASKVDAGALPASSQPARKGAALNDSMLNLGGAPAHSPMAGPAQGQSRGKTKSQEEEDEEAELAKLQAEMAL